MASKKATMCYIVVALGVWILAVGAGLRILNRYSAAPGNPGEPPAPWPEHSRVQRLLGRPTLMMLAHTECPCTRSSMGELDILMARRRAPLTAYVLFFKPNGGESEEKTDLWKQAAAIPGVRVLADEGGIEAGRFHMSTSGHVLLYDASSNLQFSGGITASRGHSGDNAGRDAIVSFLNTGSAKQSRASVFGCSLLDPKPGNTNRAQD